MASDQGVANPSIDTIGQAGINQPAITPSPLVDVWSCARSCRLVEVIYGSFRARIRQLVDSGIHSIISRVGGALTIISRVGCAYVCRWQRSHDHELIPQL